MKSSEIKLKAQQVAKKIAAIVFVPEHVDRIVIDKLAAIITTEFSALAEDDVEAALVKLREKHPNKQIAIDRTGGDGYIFQGQIKLRREQWSIRMDLFIPLGNGDTLAEALSAAMEGE